MYCGLDLVLSYLCELDLDFDFVVLVQFLDL